MRSRRLPTLLLTTMLVLQAVTMVAVVTVSSLSTRDAVVEQMTSTLELVSQDTTSRTSEFLAQAERAAQADAIVLSDPELGRMDDTTLERYLREQILVQPDLAGAYVGYPDGSFVYAGRDGAEVDGGTRTKVVSIDDGTRSVVEVQRDGEGELVRSTPLPDDTYDPRARPWYTAARGDAVTWTQPYVFFASQRPGVTVSRAIVGDDGEVEAVVGVDLSLERLSGFVGDLRISPNARVAIADAGGELIAYGDVDAVVVEEGDGTDDSRRARVEELGDPALTAAYSALASDVAASAAEGSTSTRVEGIEVGDEAWQTAVTPLEDRTDWLVAVAAPESDFAGEVVDTERRNVLFAAAVSLLVVIATLPAINLVRRRMERDQQAADTDALTGLPNRRRFEAVLAEALRAGRTTCVAQVDVDHFKAVNDGFGHAAGDAVLKAVAGRVRHALREEDVVARVGGDEFAAVLVDTDEDLAAEVLERARHALADEAVSADAGQVPVTVTIGVAEVRLAPGDDARAAATEALARADAALYAAKAAGRNRVATPAGIHTPTTAADTGP